MKRYAFFHIKNSSISVGDDPEYVETGIVGFDADSLQQRNPEFPITQQIEKKLPGQYQGPQFIVEMNKEGKIYNDVLKMMEEFPGFMPNSVLRIEL
jgi:hypothetical protein